MTKHPEMYLASEVCQSDDACKAEDNLGGKNDFTGGALLVECYLSNTASFVLCVFRRVKDHHDSLHSSPLLKKARVRQLLVDEWFPLNSR